MKKYWLICLIAFFGIGLALILGATPSGRFTDLKSAYYYIFTPKDFFKPVADVALVRGVTVCEFPVEHRYPGTYEVRIRLPLTITDQNVKKPQVRITLTDGKAVLYNVSSSVVSMLANRDGQAVIYGSYEVPKAVPISKPLRVKVILDAELEKLVPFEGTARIEIAEAARG